MTRQVECCPPDTDLGSAAMMMWEKDCGFVPVVDGPERRVIGTVTDRDICMGLATSGKGPHDRTVREVMSQAAFTVEPETDVDEALDVMGTHRIRRLPVVDERGSLQGILSVNDLVLVADERADDDGGAIPVEKVVRTLKSICEHRQDDGSTTKGKGDRSRRARV